MEPPTIGLTDQLRSAATQAGRNARELAHRIPGWLALILAAACLLRIAVWILYRPAVMTQGDVGAYVTAANGDLFSDPVHTAGYPMLLRALHVLSSDLDFTVAIQHLAGITSGLILFATIRRVGAPVWVAAVGAAAVLLSIDQIVLEHTLMAETFFVLGLMIVLYACVRTLDEPRRLAGPVNSRHAWIALAAVALGLTAWMRAVAAPLVPFLALWLAVVIAGPAWHRIARATLAAGTAAAVILVYMWFNSMASGHFVLTYAPGWALYSRTAPFADCSAFEPPEGTETLCEQTPPDDRPGPEFYGYDPQSPARQRFDHPARRDVRLLAFARRAVVHQPLEYARAVGRDFARYLLPIEDGRPYSGGGYELLDIEVRSVQAEEQVQPIVAGYYSSEPLAVSGLIPKVNDLQQILRIHPTLMLLALIIALAGAGFARGRVRAALLLLSGAGLLLLAVPSATATYSARYAIPAGGPLLGAGAIGLWVMLERRASGRTPS